MRLIDADNLKIPNDAPYKASVKRVVALQPTVEAVPVVHGKWIGNTCSACCLNWNENMVNNADDWGYFEPMPNFCPHCGADMRE